MKKEAVSLNTCFCSPSSHVVAAPHREAVPNKRVTFAPQNNISMSNDRHLSENDKGRIWYNRMEMQAFRGKAKALALRIHADRDKNDFEYSYACTMEAAFKQTRNISEEEELKLWAWFSRAHSRRGLERLSASQVGRNQQAKAAIRKNSSNTKGTCQTKNRQEHKSKDAGCCIRDRDRTGKSTR